MERHSSISIAFLLITLILIVNQTSLTRGHTFFGEDGNDILSMSSYVGDQKVLMQKEPMTSCVQPDDFCNASPEGCCPGSSCRCNFWGYNCRCQYEDMPVSFEDEKAATSYAAAAVMNAEPIDKRSSNINVYRRSCIKRGGACDHRPNECCFSSSCRCNLWGSNCRCQRVGLFQKLG